MRKIKKQSLLIILLFVVSIAVAGLLVKLNEPSYAEHTQSPATILGEGYVKFNHPQLGFSVEYPDTLSLRRVEEKADESQQEGETIVFQDKTDTADEPAGEKTGFQIFITPFQVEVGEQTRLTVERIRRDLPGIEIIEPQPVVLNPAAAQHQQIQGILFWSNDGRGNRTREVWFIHEGYLYEITTYEHLDTWLAKILSSWRLQ